jgi:CubicO group peptidase (beta-lactamase class C family)
MRKTTIALTALGVALLAGGAWYASLDRETRGIIASMPTNADVLAWTVPQRDAAFRAMDRLPALAQSNEVLPSATPLALPAGKPLDIPGVDKFLADQRSAGIVILQDGKVRFERYGLDFDAKGRWTSFSVAKSFTSTLVGAAIRDGYIKSLDDKVSQYIPDLRGSAYDDVTVRQLLTMSSGVRWNEDYEDPKADVAQFNVVTPDPGVDATVSYMRKLPRAHPPGEVWHYNTGETNLIGVVVSRATGKSLSSYASQKIWAAYGMESYASWMIDRSGHEHGGCCIQASTRDFARFGQFILEGGRVDGRPMLPEGWLQAATHKQVDIGRPGSGYGYQWWTNDNGTFSAFGIHGQVIHVDPSRGLVVAANRARPEANFSPASLQAGIALFDAIRAAIDAERPAPIGPR